LIIGPRGDFLKISPFHKNQAVNLRTIILAVHIRFHILFIVFGLSFFSKKIYGQSAADNRHSTICASSDSIKSALRVSFTLQNDSYVKNLAFFCRQEWKIEKALKVPIRFRVGSLEQCNRLEGKKN
jgi:hypothetical protein